jgi:hypothetical protein
MTSSQADRSSPRGSAITRLILLRYPYLKPSLLPKISNRLRVAPLAVPAPQLPSPPMNGSKGIRARSAILPFPGKDPGGAQEHLAGLPLHPGHRRQLLAGEDLHLLPGAQICRRPGQGAPLAH